MADETRKRWWTVPEAQAAACVFETVRRIAKQNARRRADDALFMQMYGLRDVVGLGQRAEKSRNGLDRMRFNLVASVVDTAESHIASKRPKAKFQTDDADWSLVRKAQACEQAVKGVFHANDVYAKARAAFRDSAISSLGGLYVYGEGGRVRIERTFPGEILVDAREGYYGEPLTIYRVKAVDAQVFAETYGLKEAPKGARVDDEIMRTFEWIGSDVGDRVDQVIVISAWRLGAIDPKTNKRKPGKYIVATSGIAHRFEDYKRDRLPFAFYRWERRQVGFYGRGIVEKLRGHQRAINYIDQKIADMMHKNSRSNLVVFDGNKGAPSVNVTHVDNDPATIVRVRNGGQAPVVMAQNAVPTEFFARRREIIEDGYAEIGLSQLRATGQVPKGIESGTALREVDDAGSRRWSPKEQEYETFVAVDLARLVVDELRDLAERGELQEIQVSTRSRTRTRLQMIDWKKVALKDHEYELTLPPASSLPDSTAARTQTVQEWYQAGFIDMREAKALLDFPDLERFRSMDMSAYECVLDAIEDIIEESTYSPPEPTDDLELAIKLVTQSYNMYRRRKAPREALDLLLQYLDDCRALLETVSSAPANELVPAQPGTVPAPVPTTAAAPAAGGMPAAA